MTQESEFTSEQMKQRIQELESQKNQAANEMLEAEKVIKGLVATIAKLCSSRDAFMLVMSKTEEEFNEAQKGIMRHMLANRIVAPSMAKQVKSKIITEI